MRSNGKTILKRLHEEADGDNNRHRKNLGYSLRGQPNNEELLMLPMIRLLHCMNGYQS